MSHVYASVPAADEYMLSNGASVLSTQAVATIDRKLSVLESISRLIDEKMEWVGEVSDYEPDEPEPEAAAPKALLTGEA